MSKSITDRLREVRDVVSASKLDTDTYGFWLPLRRLEEEDDDGALLGLSLLDSVGIDLASDSAKQYETPAFFEKLVNCQHQSRGELMDDSGAPFGRASAVIAITVYLWVV